MELRSLRTFCAVVDQRSFSMAGKVVSLSQPTVSLQIKSLEEEFGLRFLDRLDRKVIITPAGEVLYKYAKEILSKVDVLKNELHESAGQKVYGRLTIGAGVTTGEGVMPLLLGSFKKAHPRVEISLRILDTFEIMAQAISLELDLGIVGAEISHKDLILEKFTQDRLILITYPSHPFAEKGVVALSEMIKEPFLVREEGSGTRISLRNEFKKRGIDESDINILLELGSTGAIKQAVMDRQGISIVNQQSVQRELKSGLLKEVQIKDFELTKQFYLVLHKRTTKSRVLETFLAFLKQY